MQSGFKILLHKLANAIGIPHFLCMPLHLSRSRCEAFHFGPDGCHSGHCVGWAQWTLMTFLALRPRRLLKPRALPRVRLRRLPLRRKRRVTARAVAVGARPVRWPTTQLVAQLPSHPPFACVCVSTSETPSPPIFPSSFHPSILPPPTQVNEVNDLDTQVNALGTQVIKLRVGRRGGSPTGTLFRLVRVGMHSMRARLCKPEETTEKSDLLFWRGFIRLVRKPMTCMRKSLAWVLKSYDLCTRVNDVGTQIINKGHPSH